MSAGAVSIRIPEDQLIEIDRRAAARGKSRTAFLIDAALADQLANTVDEERLQRIEQRLGRLEELTFG